MAPIISILMSVCGTSQWLAEALLSVATSCADYELRLRANGRDEYPEVTRIAQLMPRWRTNVYLAAETIPLADSLNGMLADAKGKYCIRLDPDDALAPGKLVTMLTVAEAFEEQRPVVYGDWRDFGEANYDVNCGEPLPELLRYRNVAGYAYLAPAELLREVGGWQEVGYEDWDLFVRLMVAGGTGKPLHEVTLYHRVRRGGRLAQMLPQHKAHVAGIVERSREWFEQQQVPA